MAALFENNTNVDVLQKGLNAMTTANELLAQQNKLLVDQLVGLQAKIQQLEAKLITNLEDKE